MRSTRHVYIVRCLYCSKTAILAMNHYIAFLLDDYVYYMRTANPPTTATRTTNIWLIAFDDALPLYASTPFTPAPLAAGVEPESDPVLGAVPVAAPELELGLALDPKAEAPQGCEADAFAGTDVEADVQAEAEPLATAAVLLDAPLALPLWP